MQLKSDCPEIAIQNPGGVHEPQNKPADLRRRLAKHEFCNAKNLKP
ncbi:MAG: hypothetical protein ACRCUY_06385 [Thermoguttaceae bacterium]